MIRSVVFDMGQVLIRYEPDRYIRELGVSEEDGALLREQVFRSLEWTQMDWGELTDAEAADSICTRLPERLHAAARKLVLSWEQPILPVPGMEALLRELKEAGYGIYLLSNASFRQREYWPSIPGAELFDGGVISCEEGCVKPERGIYEALLERYGLAAAECFFVDDLPVNVQGARRCGMAGAVFRGSVDELRVHMREAGIGVAAPEPRGGDKMLK